MLAITHDFKAPLGSIMGYADLLSRLTVDERQRFYLDNMKTSSEHLLKLVVDLLDFHRLDLNNTEVNRVTFILPACLKRYTSVLNRLRLPKGWRFIATLPRSWTVPIFATLCVCARLSTICCPMP